MFHFIVSKKIILTYSHIAIIITKSLLQWIIMVQYDHFIDMIWSHHIFPWIVNCHKLLVFSKRILIGWLLSFHHFLSIIDAFVRKKIKKKIYIFSTYMTVAHMYAILSTSPPKSYFWCAYKSFNQRDLRYDNGKYILDIAANMT